MNAPPAALLDARYRVGPLIARGGMSSVYRGTDIRLDRPVAIKIMEPRLAAEPAFRARFEREARAAARIDHPAVVDVHDQGEQANGFASGGGPLLFLVMELVEGGTLRDVLRDRGALGVPAAFAVLEPVLSGLAEAHRLGLVHRDVKPENVLISRTGEVKVADFGLVTAAAQAGASTAGMIMGTVAYLSPEQVATGDADARSDVYSAGVMLYELLTGAPPYTGDTAISVAYRHVNSDVPAPSELAGDVPPELDALVQRATRRDPAGRPADAAALLAELHRVGNRLEIPRVAPPVPPARPVDNHDTLPATPHRVPAGSPVGAAGVGAAATGATTVGATAAVGASMGAGPSGTRALPRPPADEVTPHAQVRRRSRRLFTLWIAIVGVLALLVGVAAWWLGSGRWIAVPQVVGMQEVAAQQLLTDSGLQVRRSETHHDDVPEGQVATTDPVPGSELLRGATVGVTVSLGRPTVPTIAAGTPVAQAEQAIREADLTPVVGSGDEDDNGDSGDRDDDTRDRDGSDGRDGADGQDGAPAAAGATVSSTEPEAGSELPIGGQVTLVLDDGDSRDDSDDVEVPSVVGQRYDEARETLDDLGLDAEEVRPLLIGRENGRVVSQDPAAGSTVERGSTVRLGTF